MNIQKLLPNLRAESSKFLTLKKQMWKS